jgi:hypothetical protein
MSAADKTKLDGLGSGIFGGDFQTATAEGTTTTTSSSFTSKVALTSPGGLTGTYRVAYYAGMTSANGSKRYQVRLYNLTDTTELCYDENTPGTAGVWNAKSGYAYVTFTGLAKEFQIQFASQDNSTTVSCRRARIEFWRVA